MGKERSFYSIKNSGFRAAIFYGKILFEFASVEFFFAVFAAIQFLFLVGKNKDVRKFLFDGSDAAGIFAADHVFDLLGEMEALFLYDLTVFDDVYSDIVIDETKHIQIQLV